MGASQEMVALGIIGIILIKIIIIFITTIIILIILHIQLEESLWTQVKRWWLLAFATSLDLLSRPCQPLDPSLGKFGNVIWFCIIWLVWYGLDWCPMAS